MSCLKAYMHFFLMVLVGKIPLGFLFVSMRSFLGNDIQSFIIYIAPLLRNGFSVLNHNGDEVILQKNTLQICVSLSYPVIAWEIFAQHIYRISNNLLQNHIYNILDIGANRGYSALYFAQQCWVNKIYSFELFPQIAAQARRNLSLNPALMDKITFHSFGLGSVESSFTIAANTGGGGGNNIKHIPAFFLPYRDGISSMNKEFLEHYAPEEQQENIQEQLCSICGASQIIKDIVNSEQQKFIMKIDVEGAEYDIASDLARNCPDVFRKIPIIVGDTHMGFLRWLEILSPLGFVVYYATPYENGTCPFILVHKNWAKEW